MTSELIERVARAIADTTDFDGDRIASRYADSELRDIAQSAITAVIEADREAVRAEQAAELAQLRAELEAHGEVIAEQLEIRQRNEAETAKFKALAETLAGALGAYAEYCDICHGRGSIIEEDSATGADLWRDCPGCGPATDALRQYKEARNV